MAENKKKTYYDLLEDANATKPTYAGTYEQQLDDAYKQIANREKFSYDINGDALYKQYKDQYALGGKQAMMDTMGQAAALTGGYGSSYGVTAGNQAYQGYLQKLNDVVPNLYGMALDQYNQEGQDLYNMFSMAGSMRDDEYSKFQDDLSNWWQKVDYLTNRADNEYVRQQDSYEKLVSLITTTGYTPSAEELTAAGMSNGEATAYLNYYKEQQVATARSSGGSSGGSSKSTKTATKTTTAKPTTTSDPVHEIDYSGWGAGQWESYFAQIRQSEGKAAAEKELNDFTSKGLIPKNMVVYAATGARGSSGGH